MVSSTVLHITPHITGHFGDELFQAIDCTGTDNQKQINKITRASERQKNKHKKLDRLRQT